MQQHSIYQMPGEDVFGDGSHLEPNELRWLGEQQICTAVLWLRFYDGLYGLGLFPALGTRLTLCQKPIIRVPSA